LTLIAHDFVKNHCHRNLKNQFLKLCSILILRYYIMDIYVYVIIYKTFFPSTYSNYIYINIIINLLDVIENLNIFYWVLFILHINRHRYRSLLLVGCKETERSFIDLRH